MNTTPFLLAGAVVVAAAFTTTAFALTADRQVTADYVREHPDEFSVTVTKGKTGLMNFTITHNVATRMYHVAHLAVYHGGTLIATSDTPSFGTKGNNRFYFSLALEDIVQSEFSISDSALSGSGDDVVPVPSTIIHHFRLSDFVPKGLMTK